MDGSSDPLSFIDDSMDDSLHILVHLFFPQNDVDPFLMYYFRQLHFQWQLVQSFVPTTNQHASMDLSSIPLSKATFTNLWNHVGVGDMELKGIIWRKFIFGGESICVLMNSFQGLYTN
jgi:hypothetical protein